jgi:hypothetical protein
MYMFAATECIHFVTDGERRKRRCVKSKEGALRSGICDGREFERGVVR